ncbi:MAG: hypothetical protein ACI8ZN_001607 [Bacteroidia bacterium]|jgi:hypothetical protein
MYERKTLNYALTITIGCLLLVFQSCKKEDIDKDPIINTPTVAKATVVELDVYAKTMAIKSSITSEGESAVTQRGICYNLIGNPSVSDSFTIDGFGQGEYSSTISNCIIDQTYYIKSYAVNSFGTSYSTELVVNFGAEKPEISVKQILSTTTSISVELSSKDGESPILEMGCSISKTDLKTNPADSIQRILGGQLVFQNLEPNTNYYLLGFATNVVGTDTIHLRYSTTTGELSKLSDLTIDRIEANWIEASCSTTSDGGTTLLEQGFLYATTPGVSISNSTKLALDTGNAAFNGKMEGLTKKTKYYIRAYAKNYSGVAYSNELEVNTKAYNLGDVVQGGIVYWVDGDDIKVMADASGFPFPALWWQDAHNYADSSTFYGYSDWRLPERFELVDACEKGAITIAQTVWTETWSGSKHHWYYKNGDCNTYSILNDTWNYPILVRAPK